MAPQLGEQFPELSAETVECMTRSTLLVIGEDELRSLGATPENIGELDEQLGTPTPEQERQDAIGTLDCITTVEDYLAFDPFDPTDLEVGQQRCVVESITLDRLVELDIAGVDGADLPAEDEANLEWAARFCATPFVLDLAGVEVIEVAARSQWINELTTDGRIVSTLLGDGAGAVVWSPDGTISEIEVPVDRDRLTVAVPLSGGRIAITHGGGSIFPGRVSVLSPDGTAEATIDLRALVVNGGGVSSVAEVDDGVIAMTTDDGMLHLWDPAGPPDETTMIDMETQTTDISVIGNGKFAIARRVAVPNQIEIWDARTPSAAPFEVPTWDGDRSGFVTEAGLGMAIWGEDGAIWYWPEGDPSDDPTVLQAPMPLAANGGVRLVDQGLLTASEEGEVALLAPSGDVIARLDGDGESGALADASTLPDGRVVFSTVAAGRIFVWDADGGQPPVTLFSPGGPPRSLIVTTNGQLVTILEDGVALAWDVDSVIDAALLTCDSRQSCAPQGVPPEPVTDTSCSDAQCSEYREGFSAYLVRFLQANSAWHPAEWLSPVTAECVAAEIVDTVDLAAIVEEGGTAQLLPTYLFASTPTSLRQPDRESIWLPCVAETEYFRSLYRSGANERITETESCLAEALGFEELRLLLLEEPEGNNVWPEAINDARSATGC